MTVHRCTRRTTPPPPSHAHAPPLRRVLCIGAGGLKTAAPTNSKQEDSLLWHRVRARSRKRAREGESGAVPTPARLSSSISQNVTILRRLSNSADPFFSVRNCEDSGPPSGSLRNFFSFFESTRGESNFFPTCLTPSGHKKNGISGFPDSEWPQGPV